MTGCDPYIDDTREVGEVRLIKAQPDDLDGCFDVVTALDTFEHLPDPHRALEVLRRLARKRIVIDVPVPGFSWRKYGVDWLGLDPPRHLHIASPEGIRHLAEAHGLRIAGSYFRPASMYLIGSEQCAAGIPWHDQRSYAENSDVLTPEQEADYDRRARQLSASGDGDQAVFLLEPV